MENEVLPSSESTEAVISALYALQEKIRRLENERGQLLQTTTFVERENFEIKEERERERINQ